MPAVEHLWLEAIFDPQKAEELKKRNFREFVRAAAWYRTFRNELSIYGIRNKALEDFIEFYGGDLRVSREDLKRNLRKYREALYYEANIRKAC